MFDLNKLDTNAGARLKTKTIGGPWSFFRRMSLMAGGSIIEDIDNYARTHQMFHTLVSPVKRQNDTIEGFGWEGDILRNRGAHPDGLTAQTQLTYFGVPAGQGVSALFKPLSGLLAQTKYIPLKYSRLVFRVRGRQ